MKRIILAGLVSLAALFATQISAPKAEAANCDAVRCMECPVGYHLAPIPSNCCRCLPN
jgi:hypothetical protein